MKNRQLNPLFWKKSFVSTFFFFFFFQISYAGLVIFSCLAPTQSPGDLSLMPGMNMITVQLWSAQSNHSRQLLIYV